MIQIALPQARKKARIEIIPLIDIIFFLLATFILVSMSMVKNQGVPVRLPVAASSAALPRTDTMILKVSPRGILFIDKQEVSLEALPAHLETFKNSSSDPKVILQGDKEAAYGEVIAVLDVIRKAGISKIAVQTTKKGV